MFDGNTCFALRDKVTHDFGLIAVPTPDTVGTFLYHVTLNSISGESNFYAIRGCITEVVPVNQVVVAAAFTGIHSGLSGPQEQSVAGMCD